MCQKNIEKEAAKDGLFVRPRYSPGYGDLSLDVQSSFLKALNAQKTIGLFLSEGGVMQPEKSVTALMGLSISEQDASQKDARPAAKKTAAFAVMHKQQTETTGIVRKTLCF